MSIHESPMGVSSFQSRHGFKDRDFGENEWDNLGSLASWRR
jgi:hypothetical protein